jgi:hypothetical protein
VNEPLSPAKVAEALLSYAEEEFGWASYGEYINYYGDSKGKSWDIPNLGEVITVDYHSYDSDKSYDGWTEEMWIVFSVSGHLYKAEGTYTSYIGSDWEDELKLVKPKQKVIVVFEEIT